MQWLNCKQCKESWMSWNLRVNVAKTETIISENMQKIQTQNSNLIYVKINFIEQIIVRYLCVKID